MTRLDGLPDGHPERVAVPIATLTLYSASLDPDDPAFEVSGDLRIHTPIPSTNTLADVVEAVRAAMKHVLGSDNTQMSDLRGAGCICGHCDSTEGGGDT